MKRIKLILILSFFTLASLSASQSSPFNRFNDPSLNVSYFGRFEDVYSNPASFAFREDGDTIFNLGFDIDSKTINEKRGDSHSDITLSFGGTTVALTAVISTLYTNEVEKDNQTYLDIISIPHIQIDYAFKLFNGLSVGARIEGGNSSARKEKRVNNVFDLIQQSFFGQFDRVRDSEYFSVGLGAIAKFDRLSFGLYTDDVLFLSEDGNIGAAWENIFDALSLGLSYQYNQFTKDGELRFIRPRIGLSLDNIASSDNSAISVQLELLLQLLKTFNIRVATEYRETKDFSKNIFLFNPMANGYHNTSLSIQYYDFELSAMAGIPLKMYAGDKTGESFFKIMFSYSI